jgi:hypothetical protein
VKQKENRYTQILWVQRSRRGHGHPKTKPAESSLEKTGRIHDPSKIDQVKEKKL